MPYKHVIFRMYDSKKKAECFVISNSTLDSSIVALPEFHTQNGNSPVSYAYIPSLFSGLISKLDRHKGRGCCPKKCVPKLASVIPNITTNILQFPPFQFFGSPSLQYLFLKNTGQPSWYHLISFLPLFRKELGDLTNIEMEQRLFHTLSSQNQDVRESNELDRNSNQPL